LLFFLVLGFSVFFEERNRKRVFYFFHKKYVSIFKKNVQFSKKLQIKRSSFSKGTKDIKLKRFFSFLGFPFFAVFSKKKNFKKSEKKENFKQIIAYFMKKNQENIIS
jgi:hypothetical protein